MDADTTLTTLYGWYLESFLESSENARPVREAFGYADTKLEPRKLAIIEFEKWLRVQWKSDELRQAWLQTFTSGHEAEFESLTMASCLSDVGVNPQNSDHKRSVA